MAESQTHPDEPSLSLRDSELGKTHPTRFCLSPNQTVGSKGGQDNLGMGSVFLPASRCPPVDWEVDFFQAACETRRIKTCTFCRLCAMRANLVGNSLDGSASLHLGVVFPPPLPLGKKSLQTSFYFHLSLFTDLLTWLRNVVASEAP